MILIDDVKYSCLECIRGHRTSKCRHHVRPLLQVRFRGRPTSINGNPNHRIAVFAEKVSENGENEDRSPTPDVTNRCASNSTPVIILKTSAKQVIDLNDGRILGLYEELQKTGVSDGSNSKAPMINESSFINSSICCLSGKMDKSCGCCENKTKKLNKQKILKKYLQKHMNDRPTVKQEAIIADKVPRLATERDSKQVFDVVSVPGCSIPGSCCCDDTCSCAGCMVHSKQLSSVEQRSSDMSLEYVNNHTQFGMSLPLTLFEGSDMVLNSFFQGPAQYQGPFMNETPAPQFDTYASFISQQLSDLSVQEDELSGSNSCSCPDMSCDCTNCETHGIINGMKLDDLFFKPQFDAKNISFLCDEAANGTEPKDGETAALLAMFSKGHPLFVSGVPLDDAANKSDCCNKEAEEEVAARGCCL